MQEGEDELFREETRLSITREKLRQSKPNLLFFPWPFFMLPGKKSSDKREEDGVQRSFLQDRLGGPPTQ